MEAETKRRTFCDVTEQATLAMLCVGFDNPRLQNREIYRRIKSPSSAQFADYSLGERKTISLAARTPGGTKKNMKMEGECVEITE
jgi:hypothetical protein